jgi:hypothetical protein
LQNTELPNRVNQFVELVLAEFPTRLLRVGADAPRGDISKAGPGNSNKAGGYFGRGEEYVHRAIALRRCGGYERADSSA